MTEEGALLHVMTPAARAAWDRTLPLAPPSLDTEGFVHLCTPAQLAGVRARFFAGVDVVVLVLDAAALDDVRFEDTYGHGAFPHLYGAIPPRAVRSEVALAAAAAPPPGAFVHPR